MEAGEEEAGDEELGRPPRPPVRAELREAREAAVARPGAESELVRRAGGCGSREGERREEGGEAPDTDDDLRVSDEERVEDKDEKVEEREELELTVELTVLRPSSPQMLEGAGSKEGDDPMEDPNDPKPSSTPYKPRLPPPDTSPPSLLLPTPLAVLAAVVKDEKRDESMPVVVAVLEEPPNREVPASPSRLKAELRSLRVLSVLRPPSPPKPPSPPSPFSPLREEPLERLLRPEPLMEASPLSEELLSL